MWVFTTRWCVLKSEVLVYLNSGSEVLVYLSIGYLVRIGEGPTDRAQSTADTPA